MTTATRRPALRATVASVAALTVLALATACAGGGDDAGSGDGGGAVSADEDAPAPAGGAGGGDTGSKRDAAASNDGSLAYDAAQEEAEFGVAETAAQDGAALAPEAPAKEPVEPGTEQKLISNGSVQLKSDDVGQAIFDVRKVVDTYAGEVEANATETDDEGDPLRARLQIRVPTAQFDAAMQDLERVAVLIASSGNTKDVSTEVLDRDIRVQVQRRSIDRIQLLLDRAVTIRDVVAIEAQLSQRQADLAVLEKEQRYLDDQTAMATINVSVERIKEKKPAPKPKEKDDDSGFFAGLETGWDGLKTFGIGLATVLGALLPWMIVAAVLAIPGVPLLRRYRRKEAASTAAA